MPTFRTAKLLAIVSIMALAACAAVQPGNVTEVSSRVLCVHYGMLLRGELYPVDKSQFVAVEVTRRGLMVESEREIIAQRKIRVGMSQCGMYAAWGDPVRENQSVGSWGRKIQHVYQSRNYVYTENGRITSYQN